jgi:hypothetical protein
VSPVIQSAIYRALRTFVQVFLTVYLAGLASIPAGDGSLHDVLDLPLIEKALVAAIAAVLSFVHRAVLDPSPVPSMPDPVPAAGINQP